MWCIAVITKFDAKKNLYEIEWADGDPSEAEKWKPREHLLSSKPERFIKTVLDDLKRCWELETGEPPHGGPAAVGAENQQSYEEKRRELKTLAKSLPPNQRTLCAEKLGRIRPGDPEQVCKKVGEVFRTFGKENPRLKVLADFYLDVFHWRMRTFQRLRASEASAPSNAPAAASRKRTKTKATNEDNKPANEEGASFDEQAANGLPEPAANEQNQDGIGDAMRVEGTDSAERGQRQQEASMDKSSGLEVQGGDAGMADSDQGAGASSGVDFAAVAAQQT
eukprot:2356619-Rhodomonas_salina.1